MGGNLLSYHPHILICSPDFPQRRYEVRRYTVSISNISSSCISEQKVGRTCTFNLLYITGVRTKLLVLTITKAIQSLSPCHSNGNALRVHSVLLPSRSTPADMFLQVHWLIGCSRTRHWRIILATMLCQQHLNT